MMTDFIPLSQMGLRSIEMLGKRQQRTAGIIHRGVLPAHRSRSSACSPHPRSHSSPVAVLNENLARGVVRDRVLRDGQAVSIIDVQVTRDLQIARCFWEPIGQHDANRKNIALCVASYS